ncbi:MAG: DUF4886 domain-containing protein [Oscillospiraceae bacterium]|nr:DUF4886 domain-containing protein [Oscillospiraceae bacterium]
MKILSVGNSFAVDTMTLLPQVLGAAGVECTLGCLYIAGCSIAQHYENFLNEEPGYIYHASRGDGWTQTPDYSIQRALKEAQWDVVSIQHGSNNGSRYTEARCYEDLKSLVAGIRQLLPTAKIVFNMAWVPEPECTRKEMTSFGGDQLAMYRAVTETTLTQVCPVVDGVVPTGTTVQNARTVYPGKLTRDNFHLSLDLGRYMAALTFGAMLCAFDPEQISWHPETVTAAEAKLAKQSAIAALKTPFQVTPMTK